MYNKVAGNIKALGRKKCYFPGDQTYATEWETLCYSYRINFSMILSNFSFQTYGIFVSNIIIIL